ncbi:MAG: RHS repeat-associated core domain-containing protein, partial [Verrucomicrobiales bacterium]|nr:RHS repeat-associated core domain-containing protein [Verrucomicrobiales bacterium]
GLDRLAASTRFDHDDAVGRTITCSYDRSGNRTNIVDSVDADARSTVYTFDARHRLVTVTLDANSAAPLTTTNEWWPDNLPKKVSFPGGTVADRSFDDAYDKADRIKRIENGKAGQLFSSYRYTYDFNGNRHLQEENQPGLGVPVETTAYAYDRLNRLIEVQYGAAGALTNTYAPNGNRLTEKGRDPVSGALVDREFLYAERPGQSGVTFSGVNALSRIEDKLSAADSIDFEYDRNLNQIARIQRGTRRELRYDIRDQIIQIAAGTSLAEFDYNHARMRVKKLTDNKESRYLYDQSSVLVEYGPASANFATQHKYDYGYALLGITTGSGAARTRDFFQTDALMSTANLVSEAGSLRHSYRYDAWGRVRAEAGTSENPRQFTGHYRDNETGLQYFGARYYDEEQGRFLSQDPNLGEASDPPSLHRYLYANANPLSYVDEDGESATLAGFVGGFFWGAIQMGGAMVSDLAHTRYRSSGDYLSIWGQNIIGGTEIGLGLDITAASGGLLATTAGFAWMGAGFEALTFTGRAESWSDFLHQQGEGAKVGGFIGAGAWGFGALGSGVGVSGLGVEVSVQIPMATRVAAILGYEGAAGRLTVAEGQASTLARPNGLARPTLSPGAEEARIANKFMAQLEHQSALAEQAAVRSRAAQRLATTEARGNVAASIAERPDLIGHAGLPQTGLLNKLAGSEGTVVTKRSAYDIIAANPTASIKGIEQHLIHDRFQRNFLDDAAINAATGGKPARGFVDDAKPTEINLLKGLGLHQETATTYHEARHLVDMAKGRGKWAPDSLRPLKGVEEEFNQKQLEWIRLFNSELKADVAGARADIAFAKPTPFAGESVQAQTLREKGLHGMAESVMDRYEIPRALIYLRYPKLRPPSK